MSEDLITITEEEHEKLIEVTEWLLAHVNKIDRIAKLTEELKGEIMNGYNCCDCSHRSMVEVLAGIEERKV